MHTKLSPNKLPANGPSTSNSPQLTDSSTARAPVHDFSLGNNYEELFDAVALAGVRSSDMVSDLFSHTSLENYSAYEDFWPQEISQDPGYPQTYTWNDTTFRSTD